MFSAIKCIAKSSFQLNLKYLANFFVGLPFLYLYFMDLYNSSRYGYHQKVKPLKGLLSNWAE